MTFNLRAATVALMLGTAAAGLAVAAPAVAKDAPKPAGPKYTKAVQVALIAAQKAQAAGDLAGATAQVQIADAAKATPDDILAIGQTKINIGLASKDNAMIEQGLETALSSGKVAETEAPKYWRNLGAIALQRNDYPKAIRAYEQLNTLAPAGGDVAVSLAEMYQHNKQTPQAVATFAKAIEAKKASGQPVPEAWYRRSLAIAYDAKLPAETKTASIALVSGYPNPTNWRDSLTIFRDSAKFDDQGNLDVFRLQRAVGGLAGERDYAEYADAASGRGLPGEAKAVVDEGIAKGMLSTAKPYVKDMVAGLGPRVAKDKAALSGLEKESAASKTGKLAAATADGYLGYGNYAKAAPLYKAALDKGGVDTAQVNLRLGMSLLMNGDKAGATAAFQAVKGGPRETLAQFWLAYAASKA